ncbi:SpoIID/LytB domain protein [Desulfotomaculum nigrificans CO-1-SRB]|uniref:SpoIID/LytB domain protein n=1 Tax=Desulfotomaculum nigrificans (strain DSM 14880 / VKM B-2319 / CO-1-SRB) TaxID=868595 RepID=F6B4I6_DESCC|nr:SpoIID/LytB domain-containing protein [Desulfotomaculum nigrificans]AEF93009.1 SpoIID/LytB domain protein [Desulfotomaculum nigrificans CO-1-SRB]
MKNRWIRCFTLLMVVLVIVAAGCAKGPAKKPETGHRVYKSEPTISLYENETGQKKQIKLEEYVASVVAAEMEPTWPVNALAAQAILARTFTMENIESGRVRNLHGTDVSTSVEESQAYDPSRVNANVRKAVQMTRGQVITYNGKYIKAWFSASNGGKTASATEGLAYYKTPTPYIRANVDDPLSIRNTTPEIKQWTATIPGAKVREAVKSIAGRDPGPLTSAGIAKKGPSGRTEQLRINNTVVGGPAFRLAAGSTDVRSMFLTNVMVQGGNLVLTGKGYGHGVGMSQWGARNMALQGKSPQDIIRFYFKDIKIEKLYK